MTIVATSLQQAIELSVTYLDSPAARASLSEDAYWPKWDGPWWQMLLLDEMGLTARIPESVVAPFIAAMNRIPLQHFPLTAEEIPKGVNPWQASACHCQLGNVYRVLAGRGVDVDQELPWLRPWFLRYQMADGGLNCDESAYLVPNECPSSMVALIAVFEAILMCTPRDWTPEERIFLDRGAEFLIRRELRFGSETKHNAAERESAKSWGKLCFPRFYAYDTLRGLTALAEWRKRTGGVIPREATRAVVDQLEAEFGDGPLRIGRDPFVGTGTLRQDASGDWTRGHATGRFPLLDQVSIIGAESPYLTRHWRACKELRSRS